MDATVVSSRGNSQTVKLHGAPPTAIEEARAAGERVHVKIVKKRQLSRRAFVGQANNSTWQSDCGGTRSGVNPEATYGMIFHYTQCYIHTRNPWAEQGSM
jgi:hypothetical protein